MDIQSLYSFFQRFPKITTDTRKDLSKSIFFCLKGPNFDANTFAEQALLNGAAHVISDDKKYSGKENITVVDDSLKALQELSAFHRSKFKFPVIGLTGSNGKTTNKELITAVLKSKYRTYSTAGNLNNHIGVPLTLLSIPLDAEMAVIEMGANHRGEIRDLCAISKPDFGMITNIGKAHLEGFGGMEGVKKGKKELYDSIHANGKKVFVNGDDPILMTLSEDIDRVLFGESRQDYFVNGKLLSAEPFISFQYDFGKARSTEIKTHLVGNYNLYNLLAAACIGSYFDIEPPRVKDALENYIPQNNRSQLIETEKNTVILDAYNANPSSMEAALKNLAAQSGREKMAFLGQMLELGNDSHEEHQKLIDLVNSLEIKAVFVGKGYENCELIGHLYFATTDELIDHLRIKSVAHKLILVKGSRMVAMERILELL